MKATLLLVLAMMVSGCADSAAPPSDDETPQVDQQPPQDDDACVDVPSPTTVDPLGIYNITVLARNGWTDEPWSGVLVSAILADEEYESTFGLHPSFSECIVAAGTTGTDGTLDLFVRDGPMHFGADRTLDHTLEILVDQTITEGATYELVLYPRLIELTWTGQYTAEDKATDKTVRYEAFPAGHGVLDRVDTFYPKSELTWTNDVTSWADLYLGYATLGGEMFTDDFFNDEQGPSSGDVTEDDFGMWMDYGRNRCVVADDGLELVVYEVTDSMPLVPVSFTWTMQISLVGPLDLYSTQSC